METLAPEKVESCIKEMARWFVEHRRDMKTTEMRPLVKKYFPSLEEMTEFYEALAKPGDVQEAFKKQLRLEGWRAGILGPPRDFWLGIAGAERKFPLGQIVMTRGVNDLVAESAEFAKFAMESLRRHGSGDWGDLSPEDKKENELALKAGNLRLFSAYTKPGLPKIWVVTEADRSATTILFPEEY